MVIQYEDKDFLLVPLTPDHFIETVAVVNEIFPQYRSKKLGPEATYTMYLSGSINVRYCEYYVLLYKKTSEVAGTIGWYVIRGSRYAQTAWLHWFGIKSKFQGNNLGNKLLDTFEKGLNEYGFDRLKVYTSSRKREQFAQMFYMRRNMEIERVYKGGRYYKYYLRGKKINPA